VILPLGCLPVRRSYSLFESMNSSSTLSAWQAYELTALKLRVCKLFQLRQFNVVKHILCPSVNLSLPDILVFFSRHMQLLSTCVHVMLNFLLIIMIHGCRRIIQSCNHICFYVIFGVLHALHDILQITIVELQEPRPHKFVRIFLSAYIDSSSLNADHLTNDLE